MVYRTMDYAFLYFLAYALSEFSASYNITGKLCMMYIGRAALCVNNCNTDVATHRLGILLDTFCKRNTINSSRIMAIIFSQTRDITTYNAATCMRLLGGFDTTALFCSTEPEFPNSLPYTIRLLVFYRRSMPWHTPKHVYMFGAETLRVDLFASNIIDRKIDGQ